MYKFVIELASVVPFVVVIGPNPSNDVKTNRCVVMQHTSSFDMAVVAVESIAHQQICCHFVCNMSRDAFSSSVTVGQVFATKPATATITYTS